MMQNRLKGMGVALVTPFSESNEVDYVTLDNLVEMHLDCGTDFLCVLGTTAETPTLTAAEKRNIRKRIIKKVNGRLPIMLGMGSNSTLSLVEELQTEDLSGVDAILSVVPYYNKPSQYGIYHHYKVVAAATDLPIYLYNVPGRTGVNMLPETVIRLAEECPNIVGIKEASGNMQQIKEIIEHAPEGFVVLSGDDGLTYDVMKAGGAGVVSVFGNAYPREFSQMTSLMAAGNQAAAEEMNNHFSNIIKQLFADGNPGGIKSLLAHKSLVKNLLRLPLVPVCNDVDSAILSAMNELDAWITR